jgi:hypothetical protein
MKALLREPLAHFLLLGAALFLLDAWLRSPSTPQGGEIVGGEARIRNLAQGFRRTWQRLPTREEMDGLIQDHVREEVLYREALALGLDRDDTIVRRRLRQKMEFMADEAAALARPTDQQLADYLAAHAEKFRVEPCATFTHVFLDPGRRGKTLEGDAKRLLDALNRGEPAAAKLGDSLHLLEPRHENAAASDVVRLFGAEFSAALFGQKTGVWVGPIPSGYGVHLVRVEAMTPGGVAALPDVRPLVEREWASARRREVSEAFYARLREKYKVTIKMPEAAAGGAALAREP